LQDPLIGGDSPHAGLGVAADRDDHPHVPAVVLGLRRLLALLAIEDDDHLPLLNVLQLAAERLAALGHLALHHQVVAVNVNYLVVGVPHFA